MKVIIAGSRELFVGLEGVQAAVESSGFEVDEVVNGGAWGVDADAQKWATQKRIPVKNFRANWKKHGTPAGPIRNRLMAEYADALIAIWDGKSRGTKNMIEEATKRGLLVYAKKVAEDAQ